MNGAKPYSSPAISGSKLSLLDGDPLPDPSEYHSVVGAFQYFKWARPDIAFAVNQVCQFMHTPTTAHWTTVKRVLWYIKGTVIRGLIFHESLNLALTYFSNADWAGNPDDACPIQDNVFFLAII